MLERGDDDNPVKPEVQIMMCMCLEMKLTVPG